MSDQIEAQTDKITDLEKILDDKKDVLRKTEDVLQREMISRSSLETKKLELMSEISGLKLRQVAVERENVDLRKRLEMVMMNNSQQQQQQRNPVVDTIITLPPTGHQERNAMCRLFKRKSRWYFLGVHLLPAVRRKWTENFRGGWRHLW